MIVNIAKNINTMRGNIISTSSQRNALLLTLNFCLFFYHHFLVLFEKPTFILKMSYNNIMVENNNINTLQLNIFQLLMHFKFIAFTSYRQTEINMDLFVLMITKLEIIDSTLSFIFNEQRLFVKGILWNSTIAGQVH